MPKDYLLCGYLDARLAGQCDVPGNRKCGCSWHTCLDKGRWLYKILCWCPHWFAGELPPAKCNGIHHFCILPAFLICKVKADCHLVCRCDGYSLTGPSSRYWALLSMRLCLMPTGKLLAIVSQIIVRSCLTMLSWWHDWRPLIALTCWFCGVLGSPHWKFRA